MIRFLLTVLTTWRNDRSFQMICVIALPSVGAVLASVMLGGAIDELLTALFDN